MGSHCGGLGWARDSRRPAPSHGGMVWLYLIVTLFACMSCILYREVASCCCAPFGRHWCGGAAWCRRLSGGDGGVDGGDNAAAEVTVVCARARAGERERTAVAGPWEVWGLQCGATALLLLPLAASSSTSPQAVTSSVRTRTRRGATSRHARGDDDHDRDHDHDCNFDCDRRDRSEPERREMQRSYERRRWLRDGGDGGTGYSRRGACFCGDSVVHFSFSSSPAPALAKSSRPPLSPSMQRPGQDGDEKARPPVFTAPQAPGEKKYLKKVGSRNHAAAWFHEPRRTARFVIIGFREVP